MDVPVHRNAGDTERQAARAVRPLAATLEAMALQIVTQRPSTGDEVHAVIEEQLGRRVDLYSVRPRLSALLRKGLMVDSGERRPSAAGRCLCRVYRVPTPNERSVILAASAREDVR